MKTKIWREKFKKMVYTIIFIVLGVYAGLALLLFFLQNKIVFHPSRNFTGTPESLGMPFEDLTLQTDDGIDINAWYVPADGAEHTVLFCHGNAGNISHRLESLEIFHDLGVNIMIFDYRGFGKSEGSITEKGSYRDADAAWKHLVNVKKIAPEKIIVLGRSLGGGVASKLATQHTPGALIIESAFCSIPDMAAELYPIFPARMLSRMRYDTLKNISSITCPKMISHSPTDEIIPYSHGKRIFEAAPEPKRFVELYGTHNDCYFISRHYKPELEKFINSLP